MGVVAIVAVGFYSFHSVTQTPQYNAELSELTWPHGSVLVAMDASPSDQVKFDPGFYVFVSDGSYTHQFDATANEFVSPEELWVAESADNGHVAAIHKVTTTSPYTSTFQLEQQAHVINLSVAPTKQWLRYEIFNDEEATSSTCINSIGDTLGDCVHVSGFLPAPWNDNQLYYEEGEWSSDGTSYIVRMRSRLEHHEEPAAGPNMPPRRVQNEVARFSFDPAKGLVLQLDLHSSTIEKTKNTMAAQVDPLLLNVFDEKYGDYKLISKSGDGSVGIHQKSTGLTARLSAAPFVKDMSGFDLFYF